MFLIGISSNAPPDDFEGCALSSHVAISAKNKNHYPDTHDFPNKTSNKPGTSIGGADCACVLRRIRQNTNPTIPTTTTTNTATPTPTPIATADDDDDDDDTCVFTGAGTTAGVIVDIIVVIIDVVEFATSDVTVDVIVGVVSTDCDVINEGNVS